MARIAAEGIGVSFPVYHHTARSLKRSLLPGSRRLRQEAGARVVVTALEDLSFAIQPGERVALLGPNGAGKTTLLRTLTGVYEPAAGRLTVEGRIGSLIDPTAGMDSFLTGRENVLLHGHYRGLPRAARQALAEEVGRFAGLDAFYDLPVIGYSTGMNLRLAFAMTTAMTPEILLMDEWFLTGDEDFTARAEQRLAALVDGADILVIGTHDLRVVRRWCTRALRLEGGRLVADGPVAEVLGEG